MKTFILFIGLTAGAFCAAGQSLAYKYDASGNRIKRELGPSGVQGLSMPITVPAHE